jgi:hypothetical protein
MANKHRSRRTFNKEREDQRRDFLDGSEQCRQLLDLFGLSLTGRMRPKFGAVLMELTIFKDGEWQTKNIFPEIDLLSQHLGFIKHNRIDEIHALEIPSEHRNDLLEYNLKRAKEEMNKYLAKIRPLLLKRGIYLYAIPIKLAERAVETGNYQKTRKSNWILCALPASRQLAEDLGYSQEEIRALAPLQAWLIPQLVGYNIVKNADRLMTAIDGWGTLLIPQQKEQMYVTVQKHERHVLNKKVRQLLLF